MYLGQATMRTMAEPPFENALGPLLVAAPASCTPRQVALHILPEVFRDTQPYAAVIVRTVRIRPASWPTQI